MKTINLKRKAMTVEGHLKLASASSVGILSTDGAAFILEGVDAFEVEVKVLGKSKKLRRFLRERSRANATTSLEFFRRSVE
jgi:hypothetical protein